MKLAINRAIYAKIALNPKIISRERYFEQIQQKRDFFSPSLPSNAFQYPSMFLQGKNPLRENVQRFFRRQLKRQLSC